MQENLETSNNFEFNFQYFFNVLPSFFVDIDDKFLNVNHVTENNLNSMDKVTINNLLEKKEKQLLSINKLSNLSKTIILNNGQQKINELNQLINKLYDINNSQIKILKCWFDDHVQHENYIFLSQQESEIKDNMRSLRDEIQTDTILHRIKRQSLFLETAQNYKVKLLELKTRSPANEVVLTDKLIDIIKNQIEILRKLESNSLNFLGGNELRKSKNLKLEEAYKGNLIEQDKIKNLLWSLKEEANKNQEKSLDFKLETSLEKQRKLLISLEKDRKQWTKSQNNDELFQASDEAIKITQDQIKLLEIILNYLKVDFPVRQQINMYKNNLLQQKNVKIKIAQLIAPSTEIVETPLNSNNKRRLNDNTTNTNNDDEIFSNQNTENQHISQNIYFMPMFNQNISNFDSNNFLNKSSDKFSFN